MSITEAKELFALKQGYKNWVDYFINGDMTNEEIEILMELYGENRTHDSSLKAGNGLNLN